MDVMTIRLVWPFLVVLPLALASCAKPVDEGQGTGPQPFVLPQAPFLPPKADAPGECGDKAVIARFEACKAAAGKMAQAPCEVAGGTWGRIGLHEGCNCPTGQGDCPCKSAGDCFAECVLDPGSRGCPATAAEGNWRCTAYHDVVGCFCYLDDKGVMGSICVD